MLRTVNALRVIDSSIVATFLLTKTKEPKMSDVDKDMEIRDDIKALSEKMKKSITVDKDTGVASVADDLYKDNVPETLTYDTVVKVKKYDRTFFAASALTFGELAIDAMKGNKKLESATVDIPMTKYDSVTHNIDRHKVYANHLTGNGEKIDKYGTLITTYTNKGGKSNSADLRRVRKHLSELAEKKLK